MPVLSLEKNFRYWAFISYSHNDRKWAEWLHYRLESYKIPKSIINKQANHEMFGSLINGRMFPIFRDRDELAVTTTLADSLRSALLASRYLIVICSPHAANSNWVNIETKLFVQARGPEYVLLFIVAGQPHSSNSEECLPEQVRNYDYLAADARSQADGKQGAFLKIVAGILKVNYDQLRQRDAIRRLRRARAAVVVSLILSIGFSILALFALLQREQSKAANLQALKQIEYLITDVKDCVLPLGKIGVLEDIMNKTENFLLETQKCSQSEYLYSVLLIDFAELARLKGDTALALRHCLQSISIRRELLAAQEISSNQNNHIRLAEALNQYSVILSMRGLPKESLEVLHEALGTLDAVSSSDNVEWKIQYANCLAVEAELLWRAKQDQQAILKQLECVRILEQIPCDHIRISQRRQLAKAIAKLGEIQMLLDKANSWENLQKALYLREMLTETCPEDMTIFEDLSESQACLARWFRLQGDCLSARDYFNKALNHLTKLHNREPRNAHWMRLLLEIRIQLGHLFILEHQLPQAQALFQSCLNEYKRLALEDNNNLYWIEGQAITLENLGDIIKARRRVGTIGGDDDMRKVLRLYEESRRLRELLIIRDPDNAPWILGLSISDGRIGDWHYEQQQPEDALRFYLLGQGRREELCKRDSDRPEWKYYYGVTCGKISQVYKQLENWAEAERYMIKHLESLELVCKVSTSNAEWLGNLAVANFNIGMLYWRHGEHFTAQKENIRDYLQKAGDIYARLLGQGNTSMAYATYMKEALATLKEIDDTPVPADPGSSESLEEHEE